MLTSALRRKPPACRGVDPVAIYQKASTSLWVAFTAVFVIAADQWSKYWAVGALSDRSIDVFWKLRFHLTANTGFAFSTGQGLGPILGLVALAIAIVLWRMRSRFSSRVCAWFRAGRRVWQPHRPRAANSGLGPGGSSRLY